MDKATNFGLPFFYRSVLPGAALTILLAPLFDRAIRLLVDPAYVAAAWAAVAVVVGVILAMLDDPIYAMFEGRILWPAPIYEWRRRQWQAHVDRLATRAETLPESDWRWLETWDRLRRFPMDPQNRRVATRPTKLGNIIASYEDYPDRVYGLHPVAYWQRLWLCLSKDDREEIDRSWAPADGWTYTAAVFLAAGISYLGLAAASAISAALGLAVLLTAAEQVSAAYAGAALILAAIVPYWISLPGHARNGDTMKAMFDVYRSELNKITLPTLDAERAEARRIGEWLVYGYGDPPPPPPTE